MRYVGHGLVLLLAASSAYPKSSQISMNYRIGKYERIGIDVDIPCLLVNQNEIGIRSNIMDMMVYIDGFHGHQADGYDWRNEDGSTNFGLGIGPYYRFFHGQHLNYTASTSLLLHPTIGFLGRFGLGASYSPVNWFFIGVVSDYTYFDRDRVVTNGLNTNYNPPIPVTHEEYHYGVSGMSFSVHAGFRMKFNTPGQKFRAIFLASLGLIGALLFGAVFITNYGP